MKKFVLFYLCECNFPSTSAYSIHVIKMCNELSRRYNVKLVTPNSSINFEEIKKKYKISNKFKLISIYDKKKNLDFINRIIYSLKFIKIFNKQKKLNQTKIIFSRSIIASLILSLFRVKNILEIHHKVTGMTKIFYNFMNKLNFTKYIDFIILNKSLKKEFKLKKTLILDDAVDFNQFNKIKSKRFKLTCLYIGSFYKGKGLEIIINLAKICPKIKFHLYGDKYYLPKDIKIVNNIKIFDYVNYAKIPNLLSQYEVVLMPLQKKNYGRGNIDISKSTSPMKMFDYLASGKIILASKLNVYNHILVNNYNSILINPGEIIKWKNIIYKVFKNLSKYKKLKQNAKKTAKIFTWSNRVKKIEEKYFYNFD